MTNLKGGSIVVVKTFLNPFKTNGQGADPGFQTEMGSGF